MSTTTPRPPLLSDEFLSSHTLFSEDWPDGPAGPVTPTEVRNHYEATWGPLIQQLVDGAYEGGDPLMHALDAAAQHHFTPSQP